MATHAPAEVLSSRAAVRVAWLGLAGALAVLVLISGGSHAATYQVSSNADSGANTFRAAVESANANPGADTVNFQFTVFVTLSTPVTITEDLSLTSSTGTFPSISGSSIALQGAAVTWTPTGTLFTIASDITGTGSITKTSFYRSALSGTNTFTGGLNYNGGFNDVTEAALGGASNPLTCSGATIRWASSFDTARNLAIGAAGCGLSTNGAAVSTTWSGVLSGTGLLTKSGAGTLTLSGANTYSGGTTVSEGTLVGTTTSLQGAITNNAAVTFDQSSSGTYAGAMSGTGSLTKSGTGTVTMSGASTYTGATSIGAGSLLVTGSIGSSAVTLNGGTLGGTGTVGSVTAGSGSHTLAPGVSPGTLSTGALALGSGTSLQVELNGAAAGTGYDQLAVTGAVGLGGAALSVSVGSGFTPTSNFVIVSNDGTDAVTGTFNGLAQDAMLTVGSNTFKVSYTGGDGNDVVLIGSLVSIAAASVTEGDSGTATLSFTVTRTGTSGTASVDFATAAGTATAGTDFTSATGTASFADGVATATVAVTVLADLLDEADETLTVTLSNPSAGIALGTSSATGTITDNDPLPALSIAAVSVAEGNSGTTTATFTVSLSAVSGRTVSASYATSDGTAVAGSDYTASSGTVTVSAGSTSATFSVPILGDMVFEDTETFTATLSGPSNASLGTSTATGTILDEDVRVTTVTPSILNQEASTTVVIAGAGFVSGSTVSFSGSGITVGATTVDSSTQITATVTVAGNAATGARTVTVTRGGSSNSCATCFRVASAGALEVAFTPSSTCTETGSGIAVTFTDGTRRGNGVYTYAWTFGDGTTSTAASPVKSWSAPGNYSVGVTVTDNGGNTSSASQTINAYNHVTSGPTAVPVGTTQATTVDSYVTLGHRTEGAPGTVDVQTRVAADPCGLFSGGVARLAGTGSDVRVLRYAEVRNQGHHGGFSETTLTFSYTDAEVAALGIAEGDLSIYYWDGAGWVRTRGTLSNVAVPSARGLDVQILRAGIDTEANTVFVTVNRTVSAFALGNAPTVSIAAASVTEGDTGTAALSFTLTRTGTRGTASVDFATSAGTAAAGTDFTRAIGTASFADGVATATVSVTVLADLLDEADETLTLTLSNPSGVSLGTARTATGTIVDNDPLPLLSIAAVSVREGDTGTATATFTVTLSAVSGRAVTVDYATSAGTAVAGVDFVSASGTLVIPAGSASGTIAVSVLGDTAVEAAETFTVTLSNAGNAILGTAAATGTIVDDDLTVTTAAPGLLTQGATGSVVVLTGSGFASGTTVSFSGTGITIGGTTVDSATQITVSLTIAGNAATGGRTLTVTSPGGISVSCAACFSLASAGALQAAFTPSAVCAKPTATLTFTDGTTLGDGAYTYVWEFGDGTTSTTSSPEKAWSAAGDYTVNLTVTDGTAATSRVRQRILVHDDFDTATAGPTAVTAGTLQNTTVGSLLSLRHHAGSAGGNLSLQARLDPEPSCLFTSGVPALADGDGLGDGATGLLYAEVQDRAGHTGFDEVTLTFSFAQAEFDEETMGRLSLHYWNGTQWVRLRTGTNVSGDTAARDLRVLRADVDAARLEFVLIVNRTPGAFAFGIMPEIVYALQGPVVPKDTREGSTVRSPTPVISGNFDPGKSKGPFEVVLTLDGVPVQGAVATAGLVTYIPTTALPDGLHVAAYSVRDPAGGLWEGTWYFTVDTTPPWFRYSTPTDDFATIDVEADDNLTGIHPAIVRLFLDGEPIPAVYKNGRISPAVELDSLKSGEHTLLVVAWDEAGNQGSETYTWTVTAEAAAAGSNWPLYMTVAAGTVLAGWAVVNYTPGGQAVMMRVKNAAMRAQAKWALDQNLKNSKQAAMQREQEQAQWEKTQAQWAKQETEKRAKQEAEQKARVKDLLQTEQARKAEEQRKQQEEDQRLKETVKARREAEREQQERTRLEKERREEEDRRQREETEQAKERHRAETQNQKIEDFKKAEEERQRKEDEAVANRSWLERTMADTVASNEAIQDAWDFEVKQGYDQSKQAKAEYKKRGNAWNRIKEIYKKK